MGFSKETATIINNGLDQAGLNSLDKGSVTWDILGAEKLRGIVKNVAGGSELNKSQKEAIVKTLGEKWKSDDKFITNLEKDLKNPDLAKKFEQIAKNDPQKFANTVLAQYNGKNLAKVMDDASATPAAKPAATPAPVTTTAVPPSPERPRKQPAANGSTPQKPGVVSAPAQPSSSPPIPSVPTEPIAAPAAVPQPSTAGPSAPQSPATPAPSAPESPSAPNAGAPAVAGGNMSFQSALLAKFATATDEEIAARVDEDIVTQLADSIAEQAQKLGVSESNVAGFKKYFDDPKNQQAVIKNLKDNPKLLKTFAELAKDGEGTEIPEAFKEPMRKEMDKLIQNPENLASDKYAKHLVGRVNNVKLLNQISGFAKDFLGIDLTGIFTKILAAFNSPDGPLQGFMDALKNMGPAGSLHLPSNQGKSFFSRVFDNPQHSMYERQAMAATPTNGSLFHEVELKGADGKVTKVQRPNTVQVQSAEGKPVDLIPAANAALVEVRGDAYRVRVPSGINQDGTVKTTQDAWLSKQGYDDYKKAAESGGIKMNEDIARIDEDWKQLREQQRGPRVYVDRESGQTTEVAQPAAPSVSTAEQDARMLGKTALDQTGLGLMTGPTGA